MPIAQTILNIEDDRGNQMSRLFRNLDFKSYHCETRALEYGLDNRQRTKDKGGFRTMFKHKLRYKHSAFRRPTLKRRTGYEMRTTNHWCTVI